ncbi:MAG: YceI family protein [Chloroflexota bacterium]
MSKRLAAALALVSLILVACGAASQASEVAEPLEGATEEQPTEEAPAGGEAAPASGALTFSIVPSESEARFIIDEVLNGEDNTVVGTTSAISGDFTLDYADPGSATFGPITIDASTLTTDSDRRNTAIREFIMQTGQYPDITFTPTSVEGLPDSAEIGSTYPISITGDLTIKDTTHSVTFEGEVTPSRADRVDGSGRTTIQRDDYSLGIPNVPFVASVDQQIILEFDFVAAAQ